MPRKFASVPDNQHIGVRGLEPDAGCRPDTDLCRGLKTRYAARTQSRHMQDKGVTVPVTPFIIELEAVIARKGRAGIQTEIAFS